MTSENDPQRTVASPFVEQLDTWVEADALLYAGAVQVCNAVTKAKGEVVPADEQLTAVHDMALRLVLTADARAKCELPSHDTELEWAVTAQRAIKTVAIGLQDPFLAGLSRARLFTESGEDLQRGLYWEMCDQRDGGEPLNNIPRSRYAAQVALGEIYLPRS